MTSLDGEAAALGGDRSARPRIDYRVGPSRGPLGPGAAGQGQPALP